MSRSVSRDRGINRHLAAGANLGPIHDRAEHKRKKYSSISLICIRQVQYLHGVGRLEHQLQTEAGIGVACVCVGPPQPGVLLAGVEAGAPLSPARRSRHVQQHRPQGGCHRLSSSHQLTHRLPALECHTTPPLSKIGAGRSLPPSCLGRHAQPKCNNTVRKVGAIGSPPWGSTRPQP